MPFGLRYRSLLLHSGGAAAVEPGKLSRPLRARMGATACPCRPGPSVDGRREPRTRPTRPAVAARFVRSAHHVTFCDATHALVVFVASETTARHQRRRSMSGLNASEHDIATLHCVCAALEVPGLMAAAGSASPGVEFTLPAMSSHRRTLIHDGQPQIVQGLASSNRLLRAS